MSTPVVLCHTTIATISVTTPEMRNTTKHRSASRTRIVRRRRRPRKRATTQGCLSTTDSAITAPVRSVSGPPLYNARSDAFRPRRWERPMTRPASEHDDELYGRCGPLDPSRAAKSADAAARTRTRTDRRDDRCCNRACPHGRGVRRLEVARRRRHQSERRSGQRPQRPQPGVQGRRPSVPIAYAYRGVGGSSGCNTGSSSS